MFDEKTKESYKLYINTAEYKKQNYHKDVQVTEVAKSCQPNLPQSYLNYIFQFFKTEYIHDIPNIL